MPTLNRELLTEIYNAVEHALANTLGEDPSQDIVDEVGLAVYDAIEEFDIDADFIKLDERFEATVKVIQQLDPEFDNLDELDITDWVGELTTQLEEYGVL